MYSVAHLRLLAGLPGYWELRALHRDGANHMTPRGSFWLVATATADGLLYERLDHAAGGQDQGSRPGGNGVLRGMAPWWEDVRVP